MSEREKDFDERECKTEIVRLIGRRMELIDHIRKLRDRAEREYSAAYLLQTVPTESVLIGPFNSLQLRLIINGLRGIASGSSKLESKERALMAIELVSCDTKSLARRLDCSRVYQSQYCLDSGFELDGMIDDVNEMQKLTEIMKMVPGIKEVEAMENEYKQLHERKQELLGAKEKGREFMKDKLKLRDKIRKLKKRREYLKGAIATEEKKAQTEKLSSKAIEYAKATGMTDEEVSELNTVVDWRDIEVRVKRNEEHKALLQKRMDSQKKLICELEKRKLEIEKRIAQQTSI